jgi:hypothetical protein
MRLGLGLAGVSVRSAPGYCIFEASVEMPFFGIAGGAGIKIPRCARIDENPSRRRYPGRHC